MVNPWIEGALGMITPGVPGYDVRWGDILPGGDPFIAAEVPGVPEAAVVKRWVANGTVFNMLWDGKIAVQKRSGQWKIFRPKSQTVTARLNREISRAQKLKTAQKKLNKLFPKSRR